ncbi:EAL domain-containing protein [Egibacter rhizosphaerae]|uniref:EAL domain-containing protein n=1 Tax=Egibacter rhizosphaerae TaxID=1670831 RepID=A0A411YAN7_9ACTN|nr:EAL domain-containing protein [Egibacter rhizosphaerae]QBI18239.1 EAL domain-containing protein [Egibacter rhizosphaerae]
MPSPSPHARGVPWAVGTTSSLARLLALAGEELDADVQLLPPHAEPRRPEHGRLLRLCYPDGRLRAWLSIAPDRRARLSSDTERIVRLIARFVDGELAEAIDVTTVDRECEAGIRTVLERGHLRIVYQPIVDLATGDVVGVEALSRFPEPPQNPPDVWFAHAATLGLGIPLEVLAVRRAVEVLDQLPASAYLSVNVSPAAAASDELARALADVPVDRLVLEITEHAEVSDYAALNAAVDRLRARGARLAVDDTGSGFASMRHVLRLAPDIVKLDTTLTSDIDSDSFLRALGFSLRSFASAIDAEVVAEGIETGRELDALRFLGVRYGQGYYLRPPGPLALEPPLSLAGRLGEGETAPLHRPRESGGRGDVQDMGSFSRATPA